MPSIPPGVDPKIFMGHLDQWEAWRDGGDIGAAPHTLEQAACSTEEPTYTSTSPSSSTYTRPSGAEAQAPASTLTDPPIIYTCTFTSDYHGLVNLVFKKGSQAQVLQEKSLKDGRRVVKVKVDGFVDNKGKVWTGVWVPVDFVEKEDTVVAEGNGKK